jgi:deoxyribodipyrimidine photolyase
MTAGNGVAVPKEEQKLETAILWCRRDLRVTDNPALNAALQLAKRVVRIFLPWHAIRRKTLRSSFIKPEPTPCARVLRQEHSTVIFGR